MVGQDAKKAIGFYLSLASWRWTIKGLIMYAAANRRGCEL